MQMCVCVGALYEVCEGKMNGTHSAVGCIAILDSLPRQLWLSVDQHIAKCAVAVV